MNLTPWQFKGWRAGPIQSLDGIVTAWTSKISLYVLGQEWNNEYLCLGSRHTIPTRNYEEIISELKFRYKTVFTICCRTCSAKTKNIIWGRNKDRPSDKSRRCNTIVVQLRNMEHRNVTGFIALKSPWVERKTYVKLSQTYTNAVKAARYGRYIR